MPANSPRVWQFSSWSKVETFPRAIAHWHFHISLSNCCIRNARNCLADLHMILVPKFVWPHITPQREIAWPAHLRVPNKFQLGPNRQTDRWIWASYKRRAKCEPALLGRWHASTRFGHWQQTCRLSDRVDSFDWLWERLGFCVTFLSRASLSKNHTFKRLVFFPFSPVLVELSFFRNKITVRRLK